MTIERVFEEGLICGRREVAKVYAQQLGKTVRGKVTKSIQSYLENRGHTPARLVKRLRALGADAQLHQIESFIKSHQNALTFADLWAESQANDRVWGFRYLTRRDERVRISHRPLHRITLPKDHPFWLEYWPPNGFGCRCRIQVLKQKVRIKNPPKVLFELPEGFTVNVGTL